MLALKGRVDALDRELERRFHARGPRLGYSPASPGWGRSSERSSWWQWATCPPSGAPAARDSGKRVSKHRKGRGGNKILKRVLYQSAFSSLLAASPSPGPSTTASGRRARARAGRDHPDTEEGECPVGDAEGWGHLRGPIPGLTSS